MNPAAPARADQWIRRTATITVAGLAGIAAAISYSHMRQLAQTHGQAGHTNEDRSPCKSTPTCA